jgi:hypothetical protein
MNIHINIGNKPALLRSSEYCYELCFKRAQKGVETWTPEKYYSTLASAFTAILEMKIRASTASDLSELKQAMEDAIQELTSAYGYKCPIGEATA